MSKKNMIILPLLLGLGLASMPSFVQAEEDGPRVYSEEEVQAAKDAMNRIKECRKMLRRSKQFMAQVFNYAGVYRELFTNSEPKYIENPYLNYEFNSKLQTKYSISEVLGKNYSNITRAEAAKRVKRKEKEYFGNLQIQQKLLSDLFLYLFKENPILFAKDKDLENEEIGFRKLKIDDKDFLAQWNQAWQNAWNVQETLPNRNMDYLVIASTYYKILRLQPIIDSIFFQLQDAYLFSLSAQENLDEETRERLSSLVNRHQDITQKIIRMHDNKEREFNEAIVFIPEGRKKMTFYDFLWQVTSRGGSLKDDLREIRREIRKIIKNLPEDD